MMIRLFMWLIEDERKGILDKYRVVKEKVNPEEVVEYKAEDWDV